MVAGYWRVVIVVHDYLQVNPLTDWAHKYNKVADPLPAEKVALFGGQVLQVCKPYFM